MAKITDKEFQQAEDLDDALGGYTHALQQGEHVDVEAAAEDLAKQFAGCFALDDALECLYGVATEVAAAKDTKTAKAAKVKAWAKTTSKKKAPLVQVPAPKKKPAKGKARK